MRRRCFLQLSAAASSALAATTAPVPDKPAYRVVSPFPRGKTPGAPGLFPGRVISVHSDRIIETSSDTADPGRVKEMIAKGMCGLTGDSQPADSWRRFFEPSDVVGIKVNCSGSPRMMSNPLVVGEIARNLVSLGIPSRNIYVYERFDDQVQAAHYERAVPQGTNITVIEVPRRSIRNYDPFTYVEVDFFGEDDTRSNLARLITQTVTKIINVPNMKDHGAAGVTGCLKNIAYGSYSNVARSHHYEKTHTRTFIGTLASVEPLRSKTVLNIMDGIKGVWHGGPFLLRPEWGFYPKQMMFGTDPVAMDRLLIDVIENERKRQGAISVWDRSMDHVVKANGRSNDPNINRFIREPGHIEYAGTLGMGMYDIKAIQHRSLEV